MRKKITAFAVFILMVFVSLGSFSFYLVNAHNINEGQLLNNNIENGIFNEIEKINDKTLVVEEIIGERYVKYWEHVINDVHVINDSILLQLDPETGDILRYKKIWTDIEIEAVGSGENITPIKEYHWKRAVAFPDENDTGIYCSFYVPIQYPLVCWEVRYTDGTTILYDSSGDEIGDVVTAPSKGSALRGYGDDRWKFWRDNAREWYSKWCSRVYKKDRPTVSQISEYISNPDVEYFYVIAHSGHQNNRFSANDEGVYYTTNQLTQDMQDRSPMNLSVLCCCSAMEGTGPGSLSYEFRKGEMNGTVTIGYYNMGSCSCWPWNSKPWQNFMFEKMNDYTNYTMKEAFDLACAEHPCLAPHVRFVGDETLRVEIDNLVDLTGQCYYQIPDFPNKFPIKNVKIKCIAKNPYIYSETTYTDSEGYYEFIDIPRSTNITVSASKLCFHPASPNPVTFDITTATDLNFRLKIFKTNVGQNNQQQISTTTSTSTSTYSTGQSSPISNR